jgi:hypothetical protein
MTDSDEVGQEVDGDDGGPERSERPVPSTEHRVVPAHLGADRFGKLALRAAHDISTALAASGVDDDGAVLLNTAGPRQSLAETEALLDAALAEEERHRAADEGRAAD